MPTLQNQYYKESSIYMVPSVKNINLNIITNLNFAYLFHYSCIIFQHNPLSRLKHFSHFGTDFKAV